MRVLVFLLILANLLFFAWTQGYLGKMDNPDALRVQQQLLADQVTIVARDEPPPLVAPPKVEKPAKPERPEAEFCDVFADLPLAELVRVEGLAAEKYAGLKLEQTAAPASTFWVYIPPLANKQEAERKAAELKKLKAPEFFIVQDAGPTRFAISLGIFSTHEAAEERLEDLRAKGVRSAKVGARDAKSTHGSLEVRGPEPQAEAVRQSFAEWLPKSKAGACKGGKAKTPAAQ